MSRITTTYDILLSCPGDVVEELEVIKEIISDFNSGIGKMLQATLEVNYWSNNAVSEMGEELQKLLNKQFIDDYDFVICVLKIGLVYRQKITNQELFKN